MTKETKATLARIESRLETYHGETRDLVEAMMGVVRENAAALVELSAALRELREDIHDNRDETRAQTQAILRLVDRFDSGGPAAAGA